MANEVARPSFTVEKALPQGGEAGFSGLPGSLTGLSTTATSLTAPQLAALVLTANTVANIQSTTQVLDQVAQTTQTTSAYEGQKDETRANTNRHEIYNPREAAHRKPGADYFSNTEPNPALKQYQGLLASLRDPPAGQKQKTGEAKKGEGGETLFGSAALEEGHEGEKTSVFLPKHASVQRGPRGTHVLIQDSQDPKYLLGEGATAFSEAKPEKGEPLKTPVLPAFAAGDKKTGKGKKSEQAGALEGEEGEKADESEGVKILTGKDVRVAVLGSLKGAQAQESPREQVSYRKSLRDHTCFLGKAKPDLSAKLAASNMMCGAIVTGNGSRVLDKAALDYSGNPSLPSGEETLEMGRDAVIAEGAQQDPGGVRGATRKITVKGKLYHLDNPEDAYRLSQLRKKDSTVDIVLAQIDTALQCRAKGLTEQKV